MHVVIALILIFTVHLFPYLRKLLPQRDQEWLLRITKKDEPIINQITEILDQISPYYQHLSLKGKQKFIRRILFLILNKTIIGYHELKVTKEMAIVVFAAQVQLTFGLRRFLLRKYPRIILYPTEFYSNYFKQDLKGLTSGKGFVTLSWKHTVEGFAHPDDNLNLALHEFAHALHHDLTIRRAGDNRMQRFYDFNGHKTEVYFADLLKHGNRENHYLRGYAFTNVQEFFSVAVEHFFETPFDFKREMPELYLLLCKILNQDPTNTRRDYTIRE